MPDSNGSSIAQSLGGGRTTSRVFEARWQEPTYFEALGRNGYFATSGVYAADLDTCITIENYTSKGTIGRGRIVLSRDALTLRQLADWLLDRSRDATKPTEEDFAAIKR